MDEDEPSPPPRSPLEGELLNGHWRVVRLVARGDAGGLFDREHAEIGHRVRIWVLPPRLADDPGVLRRLSEELGRIDRELGAVRWLDAATDEASGVTYVVSELFGEHELVSDQFRSAADLRSALRALLSPTAWGPPPPAVQRSRPPEISLDWLRGRRLAAASAGLAPFAFAGSAPPPAAPFEAPPAASSPPRASPAPAHPSPDALPARRRRGPHPALWGSVGAVGVLVFGSTYFLQSSIRTRPGETPLAASPAPNAAPRPDPLQALRGRWAAKGACDGRPIELTVVGAKLVTHHPDGATDRADVEVVEASVGLVVVKTASGDNASYHLDGDTLALTNQAGDTVTLSRCPDRGAADNGATANAAAVSGEASLIAMALAGAGGAEPAAPPPIRDEVDVSAFAPDRLRAGEAALVQIYLHLVDQAETAAERAHAADADTRLRGQTTLGLEVARGARLDLMLDADGLAVDEPIQPVLWRGRPCAAQFVVRADAGAAAGRRVLTARVLVDGVPLGRLAFSLEVTRVDDAAAAQTDLRGEAARRYTRAFLSYSSLDRPEVLKTAQTLRATGIDFFQDILSIEPGAAWRKRLFAEIDRCDLFLLFWSSHAAASDWVRQEAEYALARHNSSREAEPDIRPIVLEGPPVPLPPPSLAELHFNDMLRYVVVASELEAKARRAP